MNIPKFTCQQCGQCCSKIRGKLSKEDYEFLKEFAYGKMPLIQLIPLEQTSFPLWDWEAKRFKEWQKEVNVDANIKPSRAIFDLNTETTIIATYFMDYDRCPFLIDDGKCKIYHTKRAYICRLFPFQRTPFLELDDNDPKSMFGTCPAVTDIISKMPKDKPGMIKAMHESFGDNFLDSVQNDLITAWLNQTIIDICKKYKIIRPAVNYPYDKLLKRIENSKKIDLTDFLVEKNIYSDEKMKRLIKRFDNNEDAKDKIREFL